MDQYYKAKWRQAEADLKALCQSNSAHVQSLAAKLQETNMEYHELHTAQERQLRLEAQALREAQEQKPQAAQMTQEHEYAIQELRRQAEEQPAIQKTLWKRQLSQQSTYKAEIHELYTEMRNMRESEMQSHLAAYMCKIEHSIPSRSVESEPKNVLNTRSPGRCSRWILPDELGTPNRPTSSGLQSPIGAPVQLGPSPQTREYSHPSPCCIPPAQWGDVRARDREEECELFGDVPAGHEVNLMGNPSESEEHQDELDNAAALQASDSMADTLSSARCVNSCLMRPRPAEEEPPSTACQKRNLHPLHADRMLSMPQEE